MSRIYFPSTITGLAGLLAEGTVAAAAEPYEAGGDDEAAEYAALMSAADVSAGLLNGPGRRVVLVAEVSESAVTAGIISLRDLVAVHADVADRAEGADPDEDLAWFGVQEIETLLS